MSTPGTEVPAATFALSPTWRAWLPRVWCLLLTLLLLGPALAPGYVLTYDMVWVPQLSLRPDFLGGATAVPRAVPSDAVVAVLDNLVPAMVLQKAMLVGALLAAGWGARRLVLDLVGPKRSVGLVAELLVIGVAVWNPFVVERLWMGHWTVLLGYGALPWIVRAGLAAGSGGRVPWLALLLGSLSHSAGLVSAAALLVTGLRPRAGWRTNLRLVLAVVMVNAPWVVAGWVHRAGAVSAAGSDQFAAIGSGSVPGPLAWLALGGIWNLSVVPGSLQGVSAWLAVVAVIALAGAGARSWWGSTPRPTALRLVVLWAIGYGIALLTWAAPGLVTLLGEQPGFGAIRDGSRMLALCLPLLVMLLAHGVMTLRKRLADPITWYSMAALMVLAPVALLPDAALGGGRLEAVHPPQVNDRARALVDPAHGEVLVLPFTSYRAPSWNDHRPILDPLGRWLRPVTLTSDVLVVDGQAIPGGDPRVAQVERALGSADAEQRARALGELGIGWVVIDRSMSKAALDLVPEVAGRTRLLDPDLEVLQLQVPVRTSGGAEGRALLVAGWGAWLAAAGWGILRALGRFFRRGARRARSSTA